MVSQSIAAELQRNSPPRSVGPAVRYDAPMDVIGSGIDLVEVGRIEEMVARHGRRFLDRCFTPDEQAYCDDAPRRRFEHYAARFAAKEAALKVIGTGWRDGIAWTDLEVVREPSGRPKLVVRGRCAEIAAEQGIATWHVSLSHTRTLAIASALGCGRSSSPTPVASARNRSPDVR